MSPSPLVGEGWREQPSLMSELCVVPWLIVSEHGVKGDDQLSHDGDDGDLWSFAGVAQSLIERLEDRVAPAGDHCGHEGDVAQRFAAPEDTSLGFEGVAFEVER